MRIQIGRDYIGGWHDWYDGESDTVEVKDAKMHPGKGLMVKVEERNSYITAAYFDLDREDIEDLEEWTEKDLPGYLHREESPFEYLDGEENPTTSALGVGQSQFAYLNQDLRNKLGVDALETGGVGPCYAVAALETDSGEMALVHADKDKGKQIENAFDTVCYRLDAEFDQATIMTSDPIIEPEVDELLRREFSEVRIDTADNNSGSLGVNEKGFYEPGNPSKPDTSELGGLAIFEDPEVKIEDRTRQVLEN